MASSLDDMEAYELLQIELDRSLQHFTAHIPFPNPSSIVHLLNAWIEYVCFIRHLSVWEELVNEDTQTAFEKWYTQSLKGELQEDWRNTLWKFLDFFSGKK